MAVSMSAKIRNGPTPARSRKPATLKSGIGATQAAVSRYANGKRTPRPALLSKIVEVTKGRVTANDFLPSPIDRGAA